MVSFRKVSLAIAALAISASLASAQVVTPFTPGILRAEGVTELLPTISFSTTTAGAYSITIYSSVAVTSAPGEAKLTPSSENPAVVGQVFGTTIVFPSVTVGAADTLTLTGVRVNANMLPTVANGYVPGTGENLFVIASPLTTGIAPLFGANLPTLNIPNAGYAVPSLMVGFTKAVDPLTTCQAAPFDPTSDTLPATGTFSVHVEELYNLAFQPKAGEGDSFATNGTQFRLTFGNTPTNTALYVPATLTVGTAPDVFTITAVSPATALANGAVAVPASGIVVYEVTASTTGTDKVDVPVYIAFTGQPVAGDAAPTVAVQYAPVSTNPAAAVKPIPRFNVSAPVTSTGTLYTVETCNTSLLFPYAVATGGYDTGLAISNTASDPSGKTTLGSKGVCKVYFYGTNAPADPYTTAEVEPGTTTAVVLSSVAPGFQGYAVAACEFNYAHGYTFVANSQGSTASYLPLVLRGRDAGYSGERLDN
jgi:hypothetical protein